MVQNQGGGKAARPGGAGRGPVPVSRPGGGKAARPGGAGRGPLVARAEQLKKKTEKTKQNAKKPQKNKENKNSNNKKYINCRRKKKQTSRQK